MDGSWCYVADSFLAVCSVVLKGQGYYLEADLKGFLIFQA